MNKFDLKLISDNFLEDDEVPAGKEYLLKYFSNKVQRRFLVYFFYFQEAMKDKPVQFLAKCFMDHTGVYCAQQWIYKMVNRIRMLEAAEKKARESFDLDTLVTIKMGEYKGKK